MKDNYTNTNKQELCKYMFHFPTRVVICKHEGFFETVISFIIIVFLFLSFICRFYHRAQNYATKQPASVFL